MPLEEANAYQQYYSLMTMMSQQSLEAWDAVNDAARFNLIDPDPTQMHHAQRKQVESRSLQPVILLTRTF
jgi:hypothetical protein